MSFVEQLKQKNEKNRRKGEARRGTPREKRIGRGTTDPFNIAGQKGYDRGLTKEEKEAQPR